MPIVFLRLAPIGALLLITILFTEHIKDEGFDANNVPFFNLSKVLFNGPQ